MLSSSTSLLVKASIASHATGGRPQHRFSWHCLVRSLLARSSTHPLIRHACRSSMMVLWGKGRVRFSTHKASGNPPYRSKCTYVMGAWLALCMENVSNTWVCRELMVTPGCPWVGGW